MSSLTLQMSFIFLFIFIMSSTIDAKAGKLRPTFQIPNFEPTEPKPSVNLMPPTAPSTIMMDPKVPVVTPMPTKTSLSKKVTTASPPLCRCVPINNCTSVTPTLEVTIDFRIVNEGSSDNCAYNQEWCCDSPGKRACGIRRINDSPNQPPGTARYGEYPWQVAILTVENNTYLGSGVLIDANHILTAAHKVDNRPINKFKVRLGDWDLNADKEKYHSHELIPLKVVKHPKYDAKTLQNGIAIIRINGSGIPMDTSPNINAACLPMSMPEESKSCWIAGWGKKSFKTSVNYEQVMKEVNVPIVDQRECERLLRATRLGANFMLDKSSFICAGGEKGKDACEGDGGAPLVCESMAGQWHVVGLVAWGIGCADSMIPGVYINVYNYLPWINEQIKAM